MSTQVENWAKKYEDLTNNDETILFWHRGLSLSDISLGYKILSKAKNIGVGQKLRFA